MVLLTLVTRLNFPLNLLRSESSRQSPLAPLSTHRYHVSFCSVFVFSGLRIDNLFSSRCPRTTGWPLWFFFHTLFFRFIPWFIPVPPHLRVCYRGYLIVPPVCRVTNVVVSRTSAFPGGYRFIPVRPHSRGATVILLCFHVRLGDCCGSPLVPPFFRCVVFGPYSDIVNRKRPPAASIILVAEDHF